MDNMSADDFIRGVHQKINRKKQYRVITNTTAVVLMTAVIGFLSLQRFYNNTPGADWADIPQIQTVYEWELYTDVESEQAWEYLIDELSLDELMELLESFEDIAWIESIRMEG